MNKIKALTNPFFKNNLNDEKIIEYKTNKKLKNKNECIIISIIGPHESGKSIFSINLAKNLENKKILLIDFDVLNNSIHSILGISKFPFKINNNNKDIKKYIYKFNKNLHILSGIDFIFPNKISNSEIKNLFNELKFIYDYIIIDTSSECFFDTTRYLIRYSDQCIFLLEGNILEIKKAKKLLNIYLEHWYINKNKINIVINKYNKNSINMNLLKKIFIDFNLIGKLNYDNIYNLLINKNFKFFISTRKIKKQFNKIINNLNNKIKKEKRERKNINEYRFIN